MPETLKTIQVFRFDQMAVQVKDKVDPAEADVDRYVGLEHIDPESLKIRRWGETSDVESSKIIFKSGDIIFGKRRAYQRKLAVADFDGICSAHAMVLRPRTDVVLEEFLPFFMQSDIFMDRAVKISVGGLSPTINWKDLAREEFALPPLEEQRRIAEVLQVTTNLSEKLQEASAAADSAQSSFLFHLFGCSDPGAIICGQILAPGHWRAMHLPDLVVDEPNALTAGPFGTIFKAKDFRDVGIPIIQLRHLTDRGVVLDELTFMDEDVYERLHKPYTVRPGDLVLAKMGEPPGLAGIYPADAPVGMVTPDVIKATLNESVVLPRFAVAMFNNARSRANLLQLCKGGTRTRVSLDELYALKWPIPSLDEQLDILRVLESFDEFRSGISDRAQSASEISYAAIAESGMSDAL